MLEILIEYVSIWAPSLIAILGVVITVISCINKTKEMIEEVNKEGTLKDIKLEIKRLAQDNEELIRCNKLLLDKITKINNYADNKKEG